MNTHTNWSNKQKCWWWWWTERGKRNQLDACWTVSGIIFHIQSHYMATGWKLFDLIKKIFPLINAFFSLRNRRHIGMDPNGMAEAQDSIHYICKMETENKKKTGFATIKLTIVCRHFSDIYNYGHFRMARSVGWLAGWWKTIFFPTFSAQAHQAIFSAIWTERGRISRPKIINGSNPQTNTFFYLLLLLTNLNFFSLPKAKGRRLKLKIKNK